MKICSCASTDNLRITLAGAVLLAGALALAPVSQSGAAPWADDADMPFALATPAGPELGPVRAPADPESGIGLLWRPTSELDFRGGIRSVMPASPLLARGVCGDAAPAFGCGSAWSPLAPRDGGGWSETSLGSQWEPLDGLRFGLDYYNRELDANQRGAVLLPRVLDFIAPGWENSLSRRTLDGEGVDLSVAYGFDAGLIGELELQVQFSQVLNQNFQQYRPLPESAYGLVGEPESQASIGFNWTRGNFSGTVSSHYTDGIMLNGQVHPAAWTTVDINFAWRTPWNASLSVGAQNLLGQDRGTQLGIEAATPPELDSAFSRVPYVRYEQDL